VTRQAFGDGAAYPRRAGRNQNPLSFDAAREIRNIINFRHPTAPPS